MRSWLDISLVAFVIVFFLYELCELCELCDVDGDVELLLLVRAHAAAAVQLTPLKAIFSC